MENENIRRYEAPVADELGQPVRFKYWDINPELAGLSKKKRSKK